MCLCVHACVCACVRVCVCEYRLWDRKNPTPPHMPAHHAIWWAEEKLKSSVRTLQKLTFRPWSEQKLNFVCATPSDSRSVIVAVINSCLHQRSSPAASSLASSVSGSYWSCRRSSSTSCCTSGSVSPADSRASPFLSRDIAWQPPGLELCTSTQTSLSCVVTAMTTLFYSKTFSCLATEFLRNSKKYVVIKIIQNLEFYGIFCSTT